MSYPTHEEICANHKLEPIVVKHSELKRASETSMYRSECPSCKDGVLLVCREQPSLRLAEEDYCIRCGRRFLYSDIHEMRTREGIL